MNFSESESKNPPGYRKMENLHIVFWLFKDISWCMLWKPLGIAMILPTLIIAVTLSWRTRKITGELINNLAITSWIIANSYWMITEFIDIEEKIFYGSITYRHLAIVPFSTGILLLAYYYFIWAPKHRSEDA